MSNYKVEVFVPGFANSDVPLMVLNLKVKHFRNSDDGRTVSTRGGHTCIFHADSNMVFSARCRHDEAFSRRKGILMCLQKMFGNKCFSDHLARFSYDFGGNVTPNMIDGWEFTGSGVKVWLQSSFEGHQPLRFLSAGV